MEVHPHKARRDLLLPGLAVYASPENQIKYADLMQTSAGREDQPSSQYARKVRCLDVVWFLFNDAFKLPFLTLYSCTGVQFLVNLSLTFARA